MWSLYVRGAFPEGAPAGPILSANVEVHVGHGTRPLEAARDTHHAANSFLHHLAGYYSRSMEFFGFKSGKDFIVGQDCSLTLCHLSHRPA